MTLPRPTMRVLAGACALTLLFAACGGDDDDSADTDTEETTASTEAQETTASEPEEETSASEPEEESTTSEADEGDPEAVATAEAINLRIEDFAEGWVEEEQSDDGEGDDIDECFTTVDLAASTVGEAETPAFSAETPDGQGAQVVQMQTIVFDSPDTATAVLAEVATPEFAACVQSSLTEDSAEGTEASFAPTVDDPPLAEESVGLAGVVQIPGQDGATQEGRLDLHAIRTAEVASFTMTLDVGATPATGFEQTLAELYTVIADRQAAEVG